MTSNSLAVSYERNRFLPALKKLIPLGEELNGPFVPKDPVTDR